VNGETEWIFRGCVQIGDDDQRFFVLGLVDHPTDLTCKIVKVLKATVFEPLLRVKKAAGKRSLNRTYIN
jgi:hypothetical protein